MAHIAGLKEQKKALSDIESMLKEIQVINDFLQKENHSGVYEISFSVENPTIKSSSAGDTESNESLEGENPVNKENKKQKRASKALRYTAPFVCRDRNVIRTCVLSSKKEKVEKIRELSKTYNIFLDSKEEEILRMFEGDM